MIGDKENIIVNESMVLRKYEGDELPENEFQRIYIENGEIVRVEEIEDQRVVHTPYTKGGDYDAIN